MLKQISRQFKQFPVSRRCLHGSSFRLGATVFDMPAMSPTMEKGGVVSWKIKEGEKFSGGDVLLEVETDKAQIEVEAQDDGVLAKILVPAGTNDIPVGKPIAFLAEQDDDLSTLEYPKLEETASKKIESKPEKAEEKIEPPQPKEEKNTSGSDSGKLGNPKQTLLPSVELLLHENGLSKEDALAKIQATGPSGRILKGDVLAYLGKISPELNVKISEYINNKSHLDLSKIQIRETKASEQSPSSSGDKPAKPEKPAKKEPLKIEKELTLSQAYSKEALQRLLTIAEQHAYSAKLYQEDSEVIDPLFEEIVAPPRNAERFKTQFIVTPSDNSVSTLKLTLLVNESILDAKQRAQLFLDEVKDQLTQDNGGVSSSPQLEELF
ncbi:Pyruvate dehydrogenase complex binding protein [Komagataella phaffii CBS 7435]|uniref:Dihydrolipoamide dehydrogenase-binding protein of pyruvate dehydrogenase complex n=2 Tax=Komagataella phaffii TaxID=460519 RepID=C4QXW5_KOMPG|nr:Dihydrolipoamide dehydrogenase (E3)-binding protein (E3BP) [Komagataella phaffii GS115]AOA61082.1 GQ67_01925T0 [Komagataella phaffii]CAH2446905.1 Pyruvate dehydrogenase complex binding protein [Komagataella phaffii CBS 7435]AOA66463.1 GQ68_01940T0 [Komagataella phaffii GS115]CAY68088.1 Dihydrolipoamide dehydrogenase (E3)-binding protein (E3BP) [Komagataella phaffii GS115]CCA37163.1 Pyruvate dehydrogenase complex binding protein [Komagataella phaffii CBS 7435]